MAAILKISKYLGYVHFDIRYGKIIANSLRKSSFDVDDVTDDVTALRQSRPSIFMFITCQNLQFWQVCSFDGLLLAKIYNFGKYVRLTVCYLPKFSILASMFV